MFHRLVVFVSRRIVRIRTIIDKKPDILICMCYVIDEQAERRPAWPDIGEAAIKRQRMFRESEPEALALRARRNIPNQIVIRIGDPERRGRVSLGNRFSPAGAARVSMPRLYSNKLPVS